MDQYHSFSKSHKGGAGELMPGHHSTLKYRCLLGVMVNKCRLHVCGLRCRRAQEQWRASFWTHYRQESST